MTKNLPIKTFVRKIFTYTFYFIFIAEIKVEKVLIGRKAPQAKHFKKLSILRRFLMSFLGQILKNFQKKILIHFRSRIFRLLREGLWFFSPFASEGRGWWGGDCLPEVRRAELGSTARAELIQLGFGLLVPPTEPSHRSTRRAEPNRAGLAGSIKVKNRAYIRKRCKCDCNLIVGRGLIIMDQ